MSKRTPPILQETVSGIQSLLSILNANQTQHLQGMPTLQGSDNIEDEYHHCVQLAVALAGNTSVLSLQLQNYTIRVYAAAAEALKLNTTLKTLFIKLGGAAEDIKLARALAKSIAGNSTLARFGIIMDSASDRTGVEIVKSIAGNSILQSFKISMHGTSISDCTGVEIAKSIAGNSTLQSFEIDMCETSISDCTGVEIAKSIAGNSILQSFEINICGITISDRTGVEIAKSIVWNSTLQSFKINMYGTNISDQTGVEIAKSIAGNSTLQSFKINMSVTSISDQTGMAIAKSIAGNSTLQSFEIHMHGTSISDQTGVEIAKSIAGYSTLQSFKINMSETSISDQTGMAIAKSIAGNSTLQSFKINMFETSISDRTGVEIAKSIVWNSTLQSFEIDMYGTNISDRTGVEIAKSIAGNSTLQSFKINMSETSISDQTGIAIAESIAGNSTLQSFEIDMYETSISDQTETAIAKSIAGNSTLLAVDMGFRCDQLLEIVKRNSGLFVQCRTLALLARDSGGFGSLSNKNFRQRLFEFFLPLGCKPAQAFVDMGMVPNDLTQHRDAIAAEEANDEHNPQKTSQQSTSTAMEQETLCPADDGTDAIAAEEKNDEHDMTLALQLSEAMATECEIAELESADIAEALMLSKKDETPAAFLKVIDAVRFRLTRHARSFQVANMLEHSPKLASVRDRIFEAGCEIRPAWAGGMWLLLPLTEKGFQLANLQQPCELDVLMLAGDEDTVKLALHDLPKEIRPKLRNESQNADATSSVDGVYSEFDHELF